MSIKEFKCNDYGFLESICRLLNDDAKKFSLEKTLTVGRLINRIVLHTFDGEGTEQMADVLKTEREIFQCYNILEEIGLESDCWDSFVHCIIKYGFEKYKKELSQIEDEFEKQAKTVMVMDSGSNIQNEEYDLTYRLYALTKYNKTPISDRFELVYKDDVEQI